MWTTKCYIFSSLACVTSTGSRKIIKGCVVLFFARDSFMEKLTGAEHPELPRTLPLDLIWTSSGKNLSRISRRTACEGKHWNQNGEIWTSKRKWFSYIFTGNCRSRRLLFQFQKLTIQLNKVSLISIPQKQIYLVKVSKQLFFYHFLTDTFKIKSSDCIIGKWHSYKSKRKKKTGVIIHYIT